MHVPNTWNLRREETALRFIVGTLILRTAPWGTPYPINTLHGDSKGMLLLIFLTCGRAYGIRPWDSEHIGDPHTGSLLKLSVGESPGRGYLLHGRPECLMSVSSLRGGAT